MVLRVELRGAKYYGCERCGAIYESHTEARQCENACSSGTCNVELTSKAIGWIRRSLGRMKL